MTELSTFLEVTVSSFISLVFCVFGVCLVGFCKVFVTLGTRVCSTGFHGLGFVGCVSVVEFSKFLGALFCPANWKLDLEL